MLLYTTTMKKMKNIIHQLEKRILNSSYSCFVLGKHIN